MAKALAGLLWILTVGLPTRAVPLLGLKRNNHRRRDDDVIARHAVIVLVASIDLDRYDNRNHDRDDGVQHALTTIERSVIFTEKS